MGHCAEAVVGGCADVQILARGRGMLRSSSRLKKQVEVKDHAPGHIGGFSHSTSVLLWIPQYPVCSQRSWRSLESCH